MNRTAQLLATLFLATGLPGASAASLSLVYTGGASGGSNGNEVTAATGDILTFELVMDFTDQPTIGGNFDIRYDSEGLQFVAYVDEDLGDFSLAPSEERDGYLFNGSIGSWDGLTEGVIATLTFEATGGAGVYNVRPMDSAAPGGPWMSNDLITVIDVTYNGVDVRVIPIPAAAWLFGSGLLAIAGLRRQQH